MDIPILLEEGAIQQESNHFEHLVYLVEYLIFFQEWVHTRPHFFQNNNYE